MTEQNNTSDNNQNISNEQQTKFDFGEFLRHLLEIRDTTEEQGTINSIKENIAMKGHNAWILVFSIFTASIGLNANSTAVVIGAMLISPLMGPILGVGLSIGINDIDTMKRSLANLGVMIVLSLLTSFLFFSVPLFQDPTPELLSRTRPDVRDVLIALSGGLALIVAISRPSPQTNTVAGVAIATALMPPLCTAGYGLAIGNFNYFFGAMFLFSINCIFIASATFVIIRYLGFSMVKYINSARRKFISRIVSTVAILILIGSLYTFYKFVLENRFNKRANEFITQLKQEGIPIIGDGEESVNFSDKTITLALLGSVSKDKVNQWQADLKERGLADVQLNIQQEDNSEIMKQVETLSELYQQNHKLINTKDETIQQKEEKIRLLEAQLQNFYSTQIDFKTISEEMKANYPNLENVSYSEKIENNFTQIDTVNYIQVYWKPVETKNTKKKAQELEQQKADEQKIQDWLKIRLEGKEFKVVGKE